MLSEIILCKEYKTFDKIQQCIFIYHIIVSTDGFYYLYSIVRIVNCVKPKSIIRNTENLHDHRQQHRVGS